MRVHKPQVTDTRWQEQCSRVVTKQTQSHGPGKDIEISLPKNRSNLVGTDHVSKRLWHMCAAFPECMWPACTLSPWDRHVK